MQLIITEKPSVGAAIAAALGATSRKNGYIEGNGIVVSWCIGHLVGLSDIGSYDDLPILPARMKSPLSLKGFQRQSVSVRNTNRPKSKSRIRAPEHNL